MPLAPDHDTNMTGGAPVNGGEPQERPARDSKDAPSVGNRKRKRGTRRAKRRRHSLSQAARDPRDDPSSGRTSPVRNGAETRSPSPNYEGLSRPSVGTLTRLEETPDEAAERLEKMKGAVRTLLECVGEDPDRSGLLDTPKRHAEALLFLTQGYQQNLRTVVNNAIFHESHNEMIIQKDIEVNSMCEHHLVPFTGRMHIAYIPYHSVIGISKLARIADMFSRRLQIQERLTKEVANAIMEVTQAQGVAVVMESRHLCTVMRGVQKSSTTTITSCVLGCFEKKEKTRNEFLSLIGLNRGSGATF